MICGTPGEKRELMHSLFPLEDYSGDKALVDRWLKELGEVHSSYNQAIGSEESVVAELDKYSQDLDAQIRSLEYEIKTERASLATKNTELQAANIKSTLAKQVLEVKQKVCDLYPYAPEQYVTIKNNVDTLWETRNGLEERNRLEAQVEEVTSSLETIESNLNCLKPMAKKVEIAASVLKTWTFDDYADHMEVENLKSTIDSAKTTIAEANYSLRELRAKLKVIAGLAGHAVCPTCSQDLDPTLVHKLKVGIQESMEAAEETIGGTNKEIEQLIPSYTRKRKAQDLGQLLSGAGFNSDEIKQLLTDSGITTQAAALSAEITELENIREKCLRNDKIVARLGALPTGNIKDIEAEIQQATEIIDNMERCKTLWGSIPQGTDEKFIALIDGPLVESLSEQADGLSNEYQSAFTRLGMLDERLDGLKKQAQNKAVLETSLADLRDQKVEMERRLDYTQPLELLATAYGNQGIKAIATRRTYETMLKMIGSESQLLLGRYASIELDDKLGINVIREGQSFDQKHMSPGQLKRIGLSCTLALRKAFGQLSNIMIVDEPFGDLDHPSRLVFIQMLSQMLDPDGCSSIFVITHEQEIVSEEAAKFDHVFKVECSKGISTLYQ